MNKAIVGIIGVAVVGGIGWAVLKMRGGEGEAEIEYRYAPVAKAELIRSNNAPGVLKALTQVDVKSKAGGIVTKLAVDEGTRVKAGDLIAVIDPRDTQALYDQAAADVRSATSRATAARQNLNLTEANVDNDIQNAEAALEAAGLRLQRAQLEYATKPAVSEAGVATARAALESASASQRRFHDVTAPQMRRDADGALNRTKSELDTAQAEFERQQDLLKSGYVSGAAVDRARSQLEAARSAYSTARQKLDTLEAEIRALAEAERLSVLRAQAALREAEANKSQVPISEKSLQEAKRAVTQAEIALKRAKDAKIQASLRREEIAQAEAGSVRSKVSLDNAKVQLDSTTVVAPRDGVVTMKYIEEGTIIPAGTSTFAQGTSIAQISDVTTMFVECAVDEADISQVRQGQNVRITLEAFPGKPIMGKVERVNPAAETANNITAVKVRVKVLPTDKVALMPGLNANCEFITLSKPDVIMIPGQAILREEGKSYVRIKTADPKKPEKREVKLGETGNDGVEVLEGLKVGEEIVIAEINLTEMKERQQRMQEAMQGGGLTGNRPAGPNNRSAAGLGASGQGGAGGGAGRGGGAGGGGR
ncbi:MAG: efflux RND transporter periplasmic adaptor subunit [Fimbriimonadaceae bacterium]|nr:efflux RND transporter periplasmic adaptor subunit [Fimbriimonadaceae bacterium]